MCFSNGKVKVLMVYMRKCFSNLGSPKVHSTTIIMAHVKYFRFVKTSHDEMRPRRDRGEEAERRQRSYDLRHLGLFPASSSLTYLTSGRDQCDLSHLGLFSSSSSQPRPLGLIWPSFSDRDHVI